MVTGGAGFIGSAGGAAPGGRVARGPLHRRARGLRPDQRRRHLHAAGGGARTGGTGRRPARRVPLPPRLHRRGVRVARAPRGSSPRTPYRPNSPYSASKAGSDHLVRAWHHTYGLPVLITNCSNNYGPYQFPEKLIPLVILTRWKAAAPGVRPGENVRDWLYVDDHADALLAGAGAGTPRRDLLHRRRQRAAQPRRGARDLPRSVDELRRTRTVRAARALIRFVDDRPGHDLRYAIDAGKIRIASSAGARGDVRGGAARTVAWYLRPPRLVGAGPLGRVPRRAARARTPEVAA
jgi:nucleoside-diphosphate-sugar epimerase